jgi:hypothetical protein
MNRISKVWFLILSFGLTGIAACQGEREAPAPEIEQEEPVLASEQEATGMPAEFVVGSYEVIGRYPDSEQIYTGTVEISISDQDPNALSVTRMIGGNTIRGKGMLTNTTGDGVVVMRVEFEEDAKTLEATYQVESDLDNYARLTGYVYAKNGGTTLPGIEALFHNHYR